MIVGGGTHYGSPVDVAAVPVRVSSHVLGWKELDTTTTVPPAPQPKPEATGSPPPARVRGSGRAGGGSRQACILSRENAHDPHGMYARSDNPTHFGAYQFDKQTWVAAGGDPSHWGSATPAEQDAAFNNYVARYGYGAWAPYDGC